MLTIRLPKEIEERLEKLAQQTGRTKTYYAREAIMKYLDDLEDLYLSQERLCALQRGDEQPVTLNAMLKQYGFAD